jgi:hypothetical protein
MSEKWVTGAETDRVTGLVVVERVSQVLVDVLYSRITGSLPFALRVFHWSWEKVKVTVMAGLNRAPSGPHWYAKPLNEYGDPVSVDGTELLAIGWMLTSARG